LTNTSVDAVLNPKDTVKQWINDVANYDDALLSLYATSDIAADVLRDTATEAFDWATGSFPTDAPLPTHSVELNISANLPNLGIPSEGGTDFNFDAGALPNIDLSVPQSVLTQNTRVATTGGVDAAFAAAEDRFIAGYNLTVKDSSTDTGTDRSFGLVGFNAPDQVDSNVERAAVLAISLPVIAALAPAIAIRYGLRTSVDAIGQRAPDGGGFPNRPLPRDNYGNPLPESSAPHTQLGTRLGTNGNYSQAREFDAHGRPVRDIDFTNHGRPQNHPNPHQHRYLPNETGGTPTRGPTENLQYP